MANVIPAGLIIQKNTICYIFPLNHNFSTMRKTEFKFYILIYHIFLIKGVIRAIF